MRKAVFIAAGAALLAWIIVWGAVWLFAGIVPNDSAEKLGQVGDMFGASSALFSGIAVAAVAIVLVFDSNERKKDLDHRELLVQNDRLALRPYVVASVGTKDARIEKSEWLGGQLSLALLVKVSLNNQAKNDPALNVQLKLNAKLGASDIPPAAIALPLAPGDAESTEVVVAFSGESAQKALEALNSSGLEVEIHVSYGSLNKTSWRSEVNYVLKAAQTKVRAIIPLLLDRDSGETIASEKGGLGGGNVYALDATASPGSWMQESLKAKG